MFKKVFVTWLDIFDFLDQNNNPQYALKRKEVIKPDVAIQDFSEMLGVLPIDMFRDLIESVGDRLYDSLVKAKIAGPD